MPTNLLKYLVKVKGLPSRPAIDKITLEFRCSGEFVSISGRKIRGMGGLNYSCYLLKLSLKIYWNLFKWFLEIEIPTLYCICLSHMKRKRNIPEMAEIQNVNFFLPWIKFTFWWNWMKWAIKLAAACFIVFGHLFQIVLDIWTPESSFGATYCMRGFLTYLSQSLEGEPNAS